MQNIFNHKYFKFAKKHACLKHNVQLEIEEAWTLVKTSNLPNLPPTYFFSLCHSFGHKLKVKITTIKKMKSF